MNRSTLVVDNLATRFRGLIDHLGELAYKRRELQIQIEAIDAEVSQLEGQKVLIEVTMRDIQQATSADVAAEQAEQESAKLERSKRAKKAAAKKKRAASKT